MKIKILVILSIFLTQWTIGQSQKVKIEDVFNRYMHTDDKSLAKLIIKSEDGLYSLFCKGELAENAAERIILFAGFIQQKPKYGIEKAFLNRGIEYYQLEKTDSALIDFNNSILLDTKEPYAYYFRGASYASLENYDKAIDDYSQAIKINPDFELAYFMRGNSLYSQKKNENAINDYNKVIELNENSDIAYLMRGIVYEAIGEYKKAISDWKEVKKLKTDNYEQAEKLNEKTNKKLKEKK
jgi:tetratricopeptide (TPR) repeat protein